MDILVSMEGAIEGAPEKNRFVLIEESKFEIKFYHLAMYTEEGEDPKYIRVFKNIGTTGLQDTNPTIVTDNLADKTIKRQYLDRLEILAILEETYRVMNKVDAVSFMQHLYTELSNSGLNQTDLDTLSIFIDGIGI